mmetsp:Transcript_96867/g.202391  ORF Transcript_96867/g.202391 Transcript_96867/m.202391 type:complete len:696 (+) Transcript_96867:75-2162(+)
MYGANLQTIPAGVDGRAALEEVKKRVAGKDGPKENSNEAKIPYLRSDHFLVRFLIARQWDVEQACVMLRDHYKWLEESHMSDLLKDSFPEEPHIKKYYPQAYHGCDKQGRPVYIERPGAIDMRRLLQVTTAERLMQYISASCETQIRRRLPACSLKKGQVIDKSLTIVDLDGLGFSMVTHNTARSVLKNVVKIFQNHYPECAGRTIIINAPKVFGIAWTFVKPLVDEKTVAKISIFGTDRAAYSEALLEVIDADQLPALFGGKCVCDGKDHQSCMRSVKGPWGDPEVQQMLDTMPLEDIMTPEGCRALIIAKQGSSQAEEEEEAAASPGEAAVPSSTTAVSTEGGDEGDQPKDVSVVPQMTSTTSKTDLDEEAEEAKDTLAGDLPIGRNGTSTELRNAEMEAIYLDDEYRTHEAAHMSTLSEWVQEYNDLTQEIGRSVIERAQGYYDSRSLWQQAVQEFAQKQEELDYVNKRLEEAVRDLAKAEAAFVAKDSSEKGWLSDEAWAQLAPLPEEQHSSAEDAMESPTRKMVEADPRLLRTLRLAALGDAVAALQWRRDAGRAELAAKNRELDESRRRFEQQEQQHVGCTWNCSVKRAQPFYDKCRMHQIKIDAQLSVLRSIEKRLQQQRQIVAALEISEGVHHGGPMLVTRSRSRSCQIDELSLHSFEIKGAEPSQEEFRDEFMTCWGSDLEEDRTP